MHPGAPLGRQSRQDETARVVISVVAFVLRLQQKHRIRGNIRMRFDRLVNVYFWGVTGLTGADVISAADQTLVN